jgi:hypothetical protein
MSIRDRLGFLWWRLSRPRRNRQRLQVIAYARASGEFDADSDVREIVEFLESAPIDIFPYRFRQVPRGDRPSVEFDADRDLHFVMHEGHRLYWRPERKAKRVPGDYVGLLTEQNVQSPHRYLTDEFDVDEEDVIADVGCAEANFTLEVIDRIRHAYLFEADPRWITALEATFAPWKDKVTIVPSMVGSRTESDTIALDDYFADKQPPTFLKLDVEGHEADVLRGAASIIESCPSMQAAVCTYHRQEDLEILTNLLEELGMTARPSRGYMLLHRSEDFAEPYFRRGLVRANREDRPSTMSTVSMP